MLVALAALAPVLRGAVAAAVLAALMALLVRAARLVASVAVAAGAAAGLRDNRPELAAVPEATVRGRLAALAATSLTAVPVAMARVVVARAVLKGTLAALAVMHRTILAAAVAALLAEQALAVPGAITAVAAAGVTVMAVTVRRA
jgi:hypothetical protein